jgi:hypothetical protein
MYRGYGEEHTGYGVVQQADRAHNLPHLPAHGLREVRGVADYDGCLRYLRSREGYGGCERNEIGGGWQEDVRGRKRDEGGRGGWEEGIKETEE